MAKILKISFAEISDLEQREDILLARCDDLGIKCHMNDNGKVVIDDQFYILYKPHEEHYEVVVTDA